MAQKSAAVVGGGIMGAGIAQVLARSGYEVAVREITEELAAEARERVVSGNYGLDDAVEGGYLSEDEKAAVLERLTFTTDLDAATDGTDFTIEAVTEDLAIKGEVFRDLDSVTDDQPLYSNTSGFSVTTIANGVADPSRVAVTHFFNPVPIMSMVEIVRTPQTDAAVVARAPRTWSTNSARPASQSTTTPAPTASSPTAVTRQYARRPGRSSTKGSRLNRKSIKRSRRGTTSPSARSRCAASARSGTEGSVPPVVADGRLVSVDQPDAVAKSIRSGTPSVRRSRYFPSNSGSRSSANAAAPSAWSSVSRSRLKSW
ncbi:3-hydroxybutyryl-CoA dehydrogenase [Natrinema altunense JCM 12890]|uniref:3-hydroxybutyryl-CoA dehydrogenase n=1 Tax=Natrinema altunense (strain JCM 12890 / CGMCC 1.3731 / AJ2) TaxID=1227494 RepID=L9ZE93_NATA2|nr:3-hydroxybutyryl-CoA dehydrogenase [Natrinema altunense JCM 12890]